MKIYQKIVNILLLLYIIIYPILPTYGLYSSDILLYSLIILQIFSFVFISEERNSIYTIIKNLSKDKLFLILILLNFSMYLSAIYAIDTRVTITNAIRFTMYIFVFYLISYKVKDRICKLLFNSFVFVATLSGLYTVGQLAYTKYLGYKIDKTIRMPSFLENPNNLGAYSILIFFIVIMIFITTKNLKYKFFYGISAILLLINVMFSQSRNALIALIIGVFIIAILYDKRFFILSLIFPILFFIIPAIRARVFQIFDMSQNSSRFNIWDVAISMIKDNPIGGIGYENFSIQYPYYISNNPNLIVNDGYLPVHPHNVFLKMQAELGIVGTVIFISFIIITIITLYKLIKSTNNNIHRSVMIGILASYLTFLFMNLLDCYFNTPKVITTMFVILGFANHHRINSSYLQRKS